MVSKALWLEEDGHCGTVHTNHVNLCNKFHLWGVLLALFFWRTLADTALLSFFIGSSGFQTILLPN